ncbi:hypothetical protein U5N28_04175 [Lysinibacillus telephonicus]|uniref:hypothetical protein n=1 Tax=Lysinibacillus telephonicus TaxID=1714840 RepID=UPI00397CF4F1
MIRKLSKEDHELLMELVNKKAAENLFIIGDVEAFGYDAEFQTLWGQFNDLGELIAVLLKFENNYIPYAKGQFDVEEFANIINSDQSMRELSGLKEIVEQLAPHIERKLRSENSFYYAKCQKLNLDKNDEQLQHVEELTINEIEENVRLLKSVPEFKTATITMESKKEFWRRKRAELILFV